MDRTPQQWVYSALVGMSLLLVGWLWQIVGSQAEAINKLQETKADRPQASDRWTGSQQIEYMRYVDSRFTEITKRMEACQKELEDDIARLHPKQH